MENFDVSFKRYGGLHDSNVIALCIKSNIKTIEIVIDDIWANFVGMAEYNGPQPAKIVLSGVKHIDLRFMTSDHMRIFEVENTVCGYGEYIFSMKLWPEGNIIVKHADCIGVAVK